MKYLGIDYGIRRIGLAVSDKEGRMAFPREVVQNSGKETLRYIAMFCEKEKIESIVIGRSLDYKMQPNAIQADIAKFKAEISKITNLSTEYQSELLTSLQASHSTDKANLDASAAAIILQSYLDSKNRGII